MLTQLRHVKPRLYANANCFDCATHFANRDEARIVESKSSMSGYVPSHPLQFHLRNAMKAL